MTCGWKARLASRVLLPVAVILLVPVIAASAPIRQVVWQGSRPASAQEEQWMEQDVRWLQTLGSLPTAAQAHPDSSDRLRRLMARAKGGERTARPGESLLRDRWIDRGYLAAQVQATTYDSLGVTLELRSDEPYRLGELEVSGEDFPGRDRLVALWLPRAGDRFVPEELRRGVERILEGAAERGHPFARWVVTAAVLNGPAREITVRARLLPGPGAVLGPITSDLAPGPAAGFLVRASGLRTGQTFRESDLRRARDRLLARDLYARVDEPRVYTTTARDTVGIHFPVLARSNANRAQVILGLSRGQDDQKSRLSGQVDLELPNLAGTGRALRVGWSDDGADRSKFGFAYLEPLAFGTPLDASLQVDHEVATDEFTRFRVANSWTLPVVALWGVQLGVGWDRTTFPAGDLEGTRRGRVIGAVEHRRADRTRSGWSGRFGVETAWRSALARSQTDTLAVGSRLGKAVTQRILLADLAAEHRLGASLSLAGRLALRQLTGQEETAPLSEQFRFGGANSVRGYREEEFHGTSAGWSSVELRIGRPRGSRLYTFLDLGYFEFSALEPLPDDPDHRSWKTGWPWGFGLGLLARTGGGDLSLAIGFPETVDFQLAKLHVSLMESF